MVLLVSFTTQAQTINFGSQWRVDYWPSIIYEDPYFIKYSDVIDGDTIIDSISYYKIYTSGYICYDNYFYFFFNHELHGFLREEGNKWYTNLNGEDKPLYDFTLEVGDTLYNAYTTSELIVEEIDSILVDGEFRKRMKLQFPYKLLYVIEGIGSNRGLFENIAEFEYGASLICYAINGVSVWGEQTGECDLTVKVSENDNSCTLFSVFPNPASEFICISFPKDQGIVNFKLVNLTGEIVYETNCYSVSTQQIPLSSYPSGIYLAIFKSEKMRKTIKLIIE